MFNIAGERNCFVEVSSTGNQIDQWEQSIHQSYQNVSGLGYKGCYLGLGDTYHLTTLGLGPEYFNFKTFVYDVFLWNKCLKNNKYFYPSPFL